MDRLQKVLARRGVASRRAAERLILAGRVSVNGEVVSALGVKVDARRDAIKVDGKRIPEAPQGSVYLMLNKPRGYVTTLSDPQGRPTVRDLVRGVRRRVYPIGRLDFASEGLLLLTDDGDLARALMHPGSAVPKTYLAKVRGCPDEQAQRELARGILLEGRRTLPCRARIVRPGSNSWLELTVTEGRKHQVRNMLKAVGHPVLKLRRVAYAGVKLGRLPSGRFRRLTAKELARLREGPAPAQRPRSS